MTGISLINPYAPQPVSATGAEMGFAAAQMATPLRDASTGNNTDTSPDKSGHGNGTGTGGAQLAFLLERSRDEIVVQNPTPKSVIEAQAEPDPATVFLERQARQQIEARAAEAERAAARAAARAADTKAEADRAAMPEYVMPNPLPTAPILERDNG